MATENRRTLPLFVVPGMPRAGTTFLYHYLQKHPDIFLPFRKEIDYFNSLYRFKGRAWFESLYRGIEEGQMAGDLSPACWFEPQCINYIKEYNPDAKIILSLRDPAEFAVSLYAQKQMSHYDLPPSLGEFVEQGYESRLTKGGGSVFFRFENAEFDEKVERYRQAFGSNLLLYDFSFFRNNQLTILRTIEAFLGLEPFFDKSNFDNLRINASYRRNVKFLYSLTAREWFRNLVERFAPRRLVMAARSVMDRRSVAGKPSEEPWKVRHSAEDVESVRKRLERSCKAFRQLFQDCPVMTGDGREFTVQVGPAKHDGRAEFVALEH